MTVVKYYRFVVCDLCEANDYRLYGISPNPEEDIHFQVVQCKRCGLIYALPQATQETLKSLYNEEYPEKVLKEWEACLSDISKLKPYIEALGKPGKMCDIGCGLGFWLKAAKELGWEVWG
ncbi:MAG: class I SAM-dependent methyltransferase [Leptospiraceae bacterium]|nr:class I SAM-dependent methyltransferase [Leptospiraceae bacterium]